MFSFSLPLTLPLSISWLGPWAGLGWVGVWLGLLGITLKTRCPRCRRRFADGLVLPLNSHCRHCGCPQFAPTQLFGPFEDSATPVAPSRSEVAPEVSRRVRLWIGAGQVVAGTFILATYGATMMRGALGIWELWSRVGFAALAVIGGVAFGTEGVNANIGWMSNVLLWIGDTTGWRIKVNLLTLALLALIPNPRPRRDAAP